ncbi:hypothetical protein LSH36_74g06024 [Paralvinella palmiformis]|uniref:Palmitoyltransferase n=1 Tax=Paralvinella palmiformis TaxID=53620 RepID=A0AAD9K470_9ANNE|nr:hypothetical protein LSH36_74g06024 [Paralvinella palmiformis]
MLIRWTGGDLCRHFKLHLDEEWFLLKLTFWSLFYNHLTSWSTIFDAALEPMFWFVDHFVRYLGPIFVLVVIVLTSSVVFIFYVCLLPHKMEESTGWTIYHLIFGHWLLINIVFQYFKAAFTDPGHPPPEIPEVVSICKKCIAPKPPRSHHCSVCNKCILKMDHHCLYVSLSAYPLFKEHFYGDSAADVGWTGLFYPYYLAKRGLSKDARMAAESRKSIIMDNIDPHKVVSPLPLHDVKGMYFHTFIIYEFMLCTAVTLSLTALILWHGRLISRGETSIEMHINKLESLRQKKKGMTYTNPYDFGFWENWKIFLGLTHRRSFWRHVLLPSSHPPNEDGLRWSTSWNKSENGILLL